VPWLDAKALETDREGLAFLRSVLEGARPCRYGPPSRASREAARRTKRLEPGWSNASGEVVSPFSNGEETGSGCVPYLRENNRRRSVSEELERARAPTDNTVGKQQLGARILPAELIPSQAT
jgi:hypothetical protein